MFARLENKSIRNESRHTISSSSETFTQRFLARVYTFRNTGMILLEYFAVRFCIEQNQSIAGLGTVVNFYLFLVLLATHPH